MRIQGKRYDVRWAVFLPDGTLILTVSRDGSARIWDRLTGKELSVLRGHKNEKSIRSDHCQKMENIF